MAIHLQKDIDSVKKRLITLGTLVEESVLRAVKSVEDRDRALAQKVIDGDNEIDRMEIDVEEYCLKTLALNQPVASDLRFIIAALKMNSDLERIGDMAVNIAERAIGLSEISGPPTMQFFDISQMADKVRAMLKNSLDALINIDASLAAAVCAADEEVDAMNRTAFELAQKALMQRPAESAFFLIMLSVSRSLERIADHTTNIAEDVIYMTKGDIVRHRALERESGNK